VKTLQTVRLGQGGDDLNRPI